MTEREIIIKLSDSDFVKLLNWTGIESILGIGKGRIKNVIYPNLRGANFSTEEIERINQLLVKLANSDKTPELLLTDSIFRKILNWSAIEKTIGKKAKELGLQTTIGLDKIDDNGKKVYGKRFKDVLTYKYFGGKFTEEEANIILEIFRNFKEKYPPII
jgi:hypothetical protein